ncbi:PA4642 family protein [Microbulbifer thermotolerans]|uniref:PA4642 family protein n=1 Tax=Microbulbifer thermotolerans TaxID=252514 RepID=UPI0008F0BDE5|nr:PA4642 family protein [Microbulbifer thermotolerans]MCX2780579.1 PA4642 family protein [Microbulbifer thermotolerans]MCX2783124.1 PA4642 family protein [Microbulbifer thermotolerans]MCX2794274.1 PA4642 family protein [Microbulbifer thermotolerans]MCX2803491.1 PA4642 family protein [Microbulbifer thermotolerans]MCX2834233.1 PA4642 family protein [Microbulbifer thermotolerans]
MSLRKDKQKVIGEVFDDERIAGFLVGEAPEGINRDYYLLDRAYRGMKAENFATFVRMFQERDLDLNCPGPDGRSLLARIEEHRQSAEYAAILKAAGAKS